MVDDLVGRLDHPQGASGMPRLSAWIAVRLAAQAPRALYRSLLDGRFRQAVARGRHAAVAAVLAHASQEFLDLLRLGEIERFGLGEFPDHRDECLDQLALGHAHEVVGMKARAFQDDMCAYCSPYATLCAPVPDPVTFLQHRYAMRRSTNGFDTTCFMVWVGGT